MVFGNGSCSMKIEKSDRMVWNFFYAIFAFGFLISFVLPETLLMHIGQSSLIPSVVKYAQCSSMPIRVTAFFNFMWGYLTFPVLALGFFHSYKPKDKQQQDYAALALILCVPLAIMIVLYMAILSEPSCVNGYLYRSDRKIYNMVNNKTSLWLMGSMLMCGLSLTLGLLILFLKTLLKTNVIPE